MNVKVNSIAIICVYLILISMASLTFIAIIASNNAGDANNKYIYDFQGATDGSNNYVTSGAAGTYAGHLSGTVRLIDHNNGTVDLIVHVITDKGKTADMSFNNVPVDKKYTVTQNRKILNFIELDNGGYEISDIYLMSEGNARISVAIGIGDTRYGIVGITNKVGLAFLKSTKNEEMPGVEDAQGNIVVILDRDITILHKIVELTDGDKTEFVEPVDNWTPSSVYVSSSRK
jgi:hypothetical protein